VSAAVGEAEDPAGAPRAGVRLAEDLRMQSGGPGLPRARLDLPGSRRVIPVRNVLR
jgi:hypothetical protein